MDRISQLPDFIVHYILSFFYKTSPAELVRMSVLSKDWSNLTASFPILDFNIDGFTSRESFLKYVEYTTSRFCHQNLTVPKFKLKLRETLTEPAELDIVNRCLGLILRNGVKEFVIKMTDSRSAFVMQKYRLPDILLSVSVLESLTIHGCDLPSSLKVDAVKFKSLLILQLQNVHIDEEVISCFTTSCPLLKVFNIVNCHGFKSFCVRGHQNIQKVSIHFYTRVERIDIEAPNLSSLVIGDYYDVRAGAPWMNLASCKKLTSVTYSGHPLPNSNGFTDLSSNFPFVENLFLVTTFKCNNLKLSSHSLRVLVLHSNCDLEEIELSTPNLASFSYICDYDAFMSLIDKPRPLFWDSTHLKACIYCYPGGYIDTRWFQKLRRFLDKKNGFKVLNLFIHAIYSQTFTELEKLKEIELPPYELEHVELQVENHEEPMAHIAFVEAVLWCCRPQSLTLRSSFPLTDFKEQSDVVKFISEKLLQQEDQGRTNIQIVSPSATLLKAVSGEGKAFSFIKEEVV